MDKPEKTALIERAFAIVRCQENGLSDFIMNVTPFVLPMMLQEIEFDQATFVSDVIFSSGELADFEGVSFKDKRLEGVEMMMSIQCYASNHKRNSATIKETDDLP